MEQRSLDLLLARKVQLLVYLERRVGSRADAEDLFSGRHASTAGQGQVGPTARQAGAVVQSASPQSDR